MTRSKRKNQQDEPTHPKNIKNKSDLLEATECFLTCHPQFSPLLDKTGPLPLRLRGGDFEGLAHIICGQMLSKASAEAIWQRLKCIISPFDAKTYLATPYQDIRDAGFSESKYRTLKGVAQAIVSNQFSFAHLDTLDTKTALKTLTEFKGIGPWTAEIYFMFCKGHLDLFPAGDLALQISAQFAFDLKSKPSDKFLRKMAVEWAPYRSIAAQILWAYYSYKKGRDI